MSKTVSVAQAKAELSQWIRWAENREPVVITRHRKPIVALVRLEDLAQLERLRAARPQAGLLSLAGGWPGSNALAALIEGAARQAETDLAAAD